MIHFKVLRYASGIENPQSNVQFSVKWRRIADLRRENKAKIRFALHIFIHRVGWPITHSWLYRKTFWICSSSVWIHFFPFILWYGKNIKPPAYVFYRYILKYVVYNRELVFDHIKPRVVSFDIVTAPCRDTIWPHKTTPAVFPTFWGGGCFLEANNGPHHCLCTSVTRLKYCKKKYSVREIV